MKKIKPKTVTVHWIDAHGYGGWQDWPGQRYDVARCITTGTVLRKTKTEIVVAQSVAIDDDGYINGVGDVMVIPMPWVVKAQK